VTVDDGLLRIKQLNRNFFILGTPSIALKHNEGAEQKAKNR